MGATWVKKDVSFCELREGLLLYVGDCLACPTSDASQVLL